MPKLGYISGLGTFSFPDTMSEDQMREWADNEQRRRRQEKVSYGAIPDVVMGGVRGAASTIGKSLASLSETVGADSVGDWLREKSRGAEDRFLGFGWENPGTKAAEIGEMIGGSAAYTGAGLAAAALAPEAIPAWLIGGGAGSLLGMGSGLEEQRERQLEATSRGKQVDDSDRFLAGLGGAALGATEALPVMDLARWALKPGMRLFGRGVGEAGITAAEEIAKSAGWRGLAKHVGTQALEEAIQEGGSQAGQNLLESSLYNPERGTWEGVPQSMLAAGVMGGGYGALGHGYSQLMARGRYGEDLAERRRLAEEAAARAAAEPAGVPPPQTVPGAAPRPGEPGYITSQVGGDLLGGDIDELLGVTPRTHPPSAEAQAAALPAPTLAEQIAPPQPAPVTAPGEPSRDDVAWDEYGMAYADLPGEAKQEIDRYLVKSAAAPSTVTPPIATPPRSIATPVVAPAPVTTPAAAPAGVTPAAPPALEPEPLGPRARPQPGTPEPITISNSIQDAMHSAAVNMGMGRALRGDLASDISAEGGDGPATALAENALLHVSTTPDAHPASFWNQMKPRAFEWMRSSNWLNPKEWSLLQRAARQSGNFRAIADATPDMPAADAELLAIRNLMRDRAITGDRFKSGDLERAYQRTLGALDATGTALKSQGLGTMADVHTALRPSEALGAELGPGTADLAAQPMGPQPLSPWQKEQIAYAKQRMGGYKPAQSLFLNMLRGITTREGGEAEGAWVPNRKAIELAYVQPLENEDPAVFQKRWQQQISGVFDHEFTHFLRNSDVFEPKQWSALVREAKKRGQLSEAQRLYSSQPGYTAEMIEEEGVSNLFRDTANNIAPSSFVKSMWQKVMNSLRRAGSGLLGRGWQTADDVMAAIRSGEVAQQQPQYEVTLQKQMREFMREQEKLARLQTLVDKSVQPGEGAAREESRAAYAQGEPERQRAAAEREAQRQASIAALQPGPIGPTAGSAQRAAQAAYAAQAPAREAAARAAAEQRAQQIAELQPGPIGPTEGAARARARAEERERSGRYGNSTTGSDGREYVWDKKKGGWVPAEQAMYALPRVSGALDEINEKFPVNPANPNERVLVAQGKPAATFQADERDGRLRLRTMQSLEPRSGIGSLLLDRILKTADKHGVSVELTASPYGPEAGGRIGKDKLVQWYESRGFKQEPGYDPALGYMVREPKGGAKEMYALPREEGERNYDVKRRTMEDLDARIPDAERVASADPTRTIEGKPFSSLDMTQKSEGFLPLHSLGAKAANRLIQRLWSQAIRESEGTRSGTVARDAAAEAKMRPPDADFWDKSFSLPQRARFWYELSGEGFTGDYTSLPPELQKRLIDAVAGTSGGVEPYPNLKRAIGILSEDMQRQPVMTDLRDPASARKALSPEVIQSLKYGSFSGTMQYTSGLTDKAPLSTNDVQVASMFGTSQEEFRKSPVLYEVVSRFFGKLRDAQNAQMEKTGEPYQPWETWQMQAPGWVYERIRKNPKKAAEYDDYHQVFPRLIKELENAGVPVPDGKITMETLMDPRTPNAMSGTREHFQNVPVATVESSTLLTPEGRRAAEAVKRLQSMEGEQESWVGKAIGEYEAIQRRAFKALGRRRESEKRPSVIAELFSAVTGKKMDVSRIDTDGYGTFEGAVSPNIRIPMTGLSGEGRTVLSEDQRKVVLAALGTEWNQAAMAASHFGHFAGENEPDTFSVFVQGYEKGIPADQISAFSSRIGYPVNATQHPNGFTIDINTGGFDTKPARDQLAQAIIGTFGTDVNVQIRERSYSSDYVDSSDYEGILNAHNVAQGRRGAEGVEGAGATGRGDDHLSRVRAEIREIATQRNSEFTKLADTIEQRERDAVAARERAAEKQRVAEEKAARRASRQQPAETLYSLPRNQKPPPLSDRILGAASALRSGAQVNEGDFESADLAVARKLAGDNRIDLDKMAQVNPDEHLTIRKFEMDDRFKEHLRNKVRLAAVALDRHPKKGLPFSDIRKAAARLVGGEDLLDIPKLKESETLKPEVRLALGITLKELESEIVRRTQELESNPGTRPEARSAAQQEIDTMDHYLRQILNVLVPARTQDGRNLVYHRIMAQGNFDRVYWNGRVKRMLGIPPNHDLPTDVTKTLNDQITTGQQATKELEDAQAAVQAAEASGSAEAQAQAKQRVKKAEDGVMDTRKNFARHLAQYQKTTRWQGWNMLWKTGLLTNPYARLSDIGSNMSFAAMERLASKPASWADAWMAGKSGERTVAEQKQIWNKAAWEGFGTGVEEAKKKLREVRSGNVSPDQITSGQMDIQQQYDLGDKPWEQWLTDKTRPYVEGMQGVQSATDMPSRQMAYAAGIREQAQLQAMREHKAGALPAGMTIDKRADQLMRAPTDDMKIEARAMEQFSAFANANWFSDLLKGKQQRLKGTPMGRAVAGGLDWVFPFVKVPTNVLSRVLEFSPLGLSRGAAGAIASRYSKEALDPKAQRMYAQLIGRGSVGSALMLLGYGLAKAGLMSGTRDADDWAGRAADEAAGRPAGSIKLPGGRWAQIGRVSPGGNILVAGASLFEQDGSLPDLLPRMGGALAKTVKEMPFMQGYETLSNAIESPGTMGQKYVQSQVGSFIPAGVARLAASVDPLQRDTKDQGFWAGAMQRLPGASYALPERRDVLGRTMEQPGLTALGPILDPFRTQKERSDPVSQAILRDQPQIPKPQRDKKNGEDVQTFRKRAELAGRFYYQGILEALQSPEYAEAKTQSERAEILKEGREAGGRELSKITSRDDTYKESTPAEKQRMLDDYLASMQEYAVQ